MLDNGMVTLHSFSTLKVRGDYSRFHLIEEDTKTWDKVIIEDGVPGLLRTFGAMIRLFVRFPLRPALRLLVLLHCFLLLLGCLTVHLLLVLVRLPGLACIFFDTHALSSSRYRPCNTQGDQQCQNRNSFHSEFPF